MVSLRPNAEGSGSQSAGPSKIVGLNPVQIQMRLVERRQWWLWVSAIAVTLLLTLGILSFTFQFLIGGQDQTFYLFNLNNSARGLIGVVFLFDLYCIYQQMQIHRIQRQLTNTDAQLRQAQKMEAVGRLSGGIAHDFNNLLGVIIGYAEELEGCEGGTDKQRGYAEQIKKAGLRASSLTRQLLAFSRQQVLQPRVLDLNSTMSDLGKMLRRLIGEDVEFMLALDPTLGRVKVDQGQIEQVIMNLVVNARDAMPEGGKLTITTTNAQLSKKQADQMPYVQPGPYIRVSVTDTGTGMDPETKAHIFEPFFTTKGKGKGTGLGLATVYGIVKQSGGYIWVSSELGQGTTFNIYLPQVSDAEPTVSPTARTAETVKVHGTVLLVEDEDSLRELISELLTRHGYRVLSASTGAQALEIVRDFNDRVHLLLTDVVLPGMSGVLLGRTLSASLPELRVIYMSGYSEFQSYGRGGLPPEDRLLQKPFTMETLLREVSEMLSLAGIEAPC